MNDSRSGTGDAAGFEESQAGFDESEQVAAGRGVADEDEVVERDFANRGVVRENVQRDFANREITPQDVAHGSVGTGERAAGTSAREGMAGDTGFQGTESMPDSARPELTDVAETEETRRVADPRTDV